MERNRAQKAHPQRPASQGRRYQDKALARTAVWRALQEAKAGRFPFPLQGRIPNFDGAERAATRLLAHPLFERVRCVKVNPDSPQRHVRKVLLDRGITIITPTPRLQGGFFRLDPAVIPKEHYWDAASLKRGGQWGVEVALEQLPAIDAIVMGSVAVTRSGKRLGKGHGYADLEFGILRELGHPAVPVMTTVHALQILEDFPVETHDVPVAIIATPDELIEIEDPLPAPAGIDWQSLPAEALEEMPILKQLKALRGV